MKPKHICGWPDCLDHWVVFFNNQGKIERLCYRHFQWMCSFETKFERKPADEEKQVVHEGNEGSEETQTDADPRY
jgi:hypothetical protein